MNKYFAAAPRHIEDLASREAEAAGGLNIALTRGGVSFEGDLACAYRFCLWSRVSSRLLLEIGRWEGAEEDPYYRNLLNYPWETLFTVDDGFLCDMTGSGQPPFADRFALLKLKDAIVDRFREQTGRRPSVDRELSLIHI